MRVTNVTNDARNIVTDPSTLPLLFIWDNYRALCWEYLFGWNCLSLWNNNKSGLCCNEVMMHCSLSLQQNHSQAVWCKYDSSYLMCVMSIFSENLNFPFPYNFQNFNSHDQMKVQWNCLWLVGCFCMLVSKSLSFKAGLAVVMQWGPDPD